MKEVKSSKDVIVNLKRDERGGVDGRVSLSRVRGIANLSLTVSFRFPSNLTFILFGATSGLQLILLLPKSYEYCNIVTFTVEKTVTFLSIKQWTGLKEYYLITR